MSFVSLGLVSLALLPPSLLFVILASVHSEAYSSTYISSPFLLVNPTFVLNKLDAIILSYFISVFMAAWDLGKMGPFDVTSQTSQTGP